MSIRSIPRSRARTRRWLAAATVVAAVLSLTAACGDDDSSSTGSGSGDAGASTQEVCDQVDALQSSLTGLSQVDVVQNGTSAVSAQLDEIEKDTDALAESTGNEFEPEVDDLKSSLSDLQTTLGETGSDTASINALIDGIQLVATSATNLVDKITATDCGD